MTDLTSLTIAEAREGLASKSFTAAELTDAHLAAIEAAPSDFDAEQALAAALKAVAAALGVPLPLDLDAIRALNNDLRGDDTHPAPMSDRRLASIASNAHECDYDDFAEVIVEAARARAEVTRLRAIEAAARAAASFAR